MSDKALTDYKVLTFDCYGTLIDWETGIFAALQPLMEKAGSDPGRDAALEAFARYETEQEAATPDMLYPDLLAAVHARLRAHWGVDGNGDLDRRFGQSVKDWPAFADSAESLAYLKQHGLLECPARFDVVAVTWPSKTRRPQIEHFPNAFEAVGAGQMFN